MLNVSVDETVHDLGLIPLHLILKELYNLLNFLVNNALGQSWSAHAVSVHDNLLRELAIVLDVSLHGIINEPLEEQDSINRCSLVLLVFKSFTS